MKIALIGPGIMPIPPQGWGAIESLLWNYKNFLERMGHTVEIFNSRDLRGVAATINNGSYDFIQAHFDEHIEDLNRLLTQAYCNSTHRGFFLNTAMWGSHGWKVYFNSLRSPGIIALSGKVAERYRKDGYRGFLRVLRNGADCDRFRFGEQGNGRAICLGKIEKGDRKSQVLLSRMLRDRVPVDFVGPCENPDFHADGMCRYLGAWDKETVHKHLTDYSCLLLISQGELAPLVVPEALSAGLSLVVSEAASANLDPKPFISVLPDDCQDPDVLSETVHRQMAGNGGYREAIRKYAKEHFDWQVIMLEYLKLIEQFNAGPRKLQAGSFLVALTGARCRLREFVSKRLPREVKQRLKWLWGRMCSAGKRGTCCGKDSL